ncbi:MAG: ATP-binding cassette domain-containing protein [Gammaproteobacteria bacterium]
MLNFSNVTLRRGARLLFEQMTLTVYERQKVGVTGANGSGKSSLFSLLLGELQADTGDVSVPPGLTLAHVRQENPVGATAAIDYALDGDEELREVEAALAAENTDGKHIAQLHGRLEEIGGYSARSRAARLLDGLGFSAARMEMPVDALSGGWRMRLNLAQALMCRSDLLLLDEPTNHLDIDAVVWLQEWLNNYQGTLLLISHDRDLLDQICTHTLHIERQRVEYGAGNYSVFERRRAARLAGQQAAHQKQQTEIAHMRAFVERFRYKASKARQAQSRLKALERMEQIASAHVDSPFCFSFRSPDKLQSPLLRLEHAQAGYDNTAVLTDLNVSLQPGDRIALLGRNGAGKSTLVKLLALELSLMQGQRLTAKELNTGYFAQHQIEQLNPQQCALWHLRRLDDKAAEKDLRAHLGGFGFQGDRVLQTSGTFSGGEKARLVLALIVYQRPSLLLLDEPTNHLDMNMRHALAVALQDFAGAVVLVTHDRHLLRLVTNELWLVANGTATKFTGDLDDYARWLMERVETTHSAEDELPQSATPTARRRRQQNAESRRRLQPLRNNVAQLDRQLQKLYNEKARLHERLSDANLYDPESKGELNALLQDKGKVERKLGSIEERWLAARAQIEQDEAAEL